MKPSSPFGKRGSSPVGPFAFQHVGDGDLEASITVDTGGRRPQRPRFGELLQHVEEARSPTPTLPDRQPAELDRREQAVPFVLSFADLTYSVQLRPGMLAGGCKRTLPSTTAESVEAASKFSDTKTLLNRVTGEARDGEILAVLGASGSGKSTLIDALANRIAKESLQGTVKLNGEAVGERLMRSISAYVRQDDLLFPMLTVEETLSFAAEFRLPRTLPKEKKQSRVQALIEQLGLRRAAKTIIGDEGHRGVSGGERRRVSIGIDIIHDPILLFLDEPTSGLDSTSAFMVAKVLQRIARTGSIVIMSVHQPSYRIVGLLDRMIFLSRGNAVYSGPPAQLPAFLAEFGSPVPENENQIEFALDLVRQLEASTGGIKVLVDFHNNWKATRFAPSLQSNKKGGLTLKEAISASISRGKLVCGNATQGRQNSSESMPEFANPLWKETAILTKRSVMNTRRLPELFFMRLAVVMVTGFILATIFWRLDSSPKGVQERLGFFAFAMSTTFYTCADALPVFLQERYIFMRETAYNAYRRSSYVLSNAIVAAPPLVLLSLAFSLITFFAVGLAGGGESFLYFFAITFASFWAGSGFVTFISGVVSQVMLGYIVVVAVLAYFLLFSGFFINRDRIPSYWLWFHYLSLVKYPYEGVLQNEFESTSKCFSTGEQMFDNTPLKGLSAATKAELLQSLSSSLGMNVTMSTCVTTGMDILKDQSITQLSKWNCFWVTVAWGFLFRFLFYVALLIGSKNKRR
ncbi:ABC transporter G family member 6-like [Nymphaea colorata]|uniref:ABC transporter domain-containing protein n=1 Tax=Nymphaea colorata TaxID=210225 RepID=A0A5K1D2V0_9MAGN|nr:ABC transporter G family member 6-like [Nymphaea colorata]